MRSRRPVLNHQRFLAALVIAALAAIGPATPAAGVAGFGDVGLGKFYTVAVQWMVDNDITQGTSPTCFSPNDDVTRGQGAAFMWRMEGTPAPGPMHGFRDVVKEWQHGPVSWMVNNDITTGTGPDTFDPERSLTRGELAALLWRLAGEPAGAPPHPFGDIVAGWQHAPVSWMFDEGITTGTSANTFSPDDTLTRGQAATFFYRYEGAPKVPVDQTHPTDPACTDQVAGPAAPPMIAAVDAITTRPFSGTDLKLHDAEGMAYVPAGAGGQAVDTIWIADDNGAPDEVLFEINASTGAWISSLEVSDLAAALPFGGGGPAAGAARAGDLESLAYDPANDVLYAFSGTTNGAGGSPTAFRLVRSGGSFAVDTYQPMSDGADSAAARPDGSLYIVQHDVTTPNDLHSYDYATNTIGPGFRIPGVPRGIWGMGFSPNGADLWIGNDVTTLFRVDWATMTVDDGYRFSVGDTLGEPTAVEIIDGRLYLLDGDDALGSGNPLKYAIHIFSLTT